MDAHLKVSGAVMNEVSFLGAVTMFKQIDSKKRKLRRNRSFGRKKANRKQKRSKGE